MKKIVLLLVLALTGNLLLAQVPHGTQYGIQLSQKIVVPNENILIQSVTVERLKRKLAKSYYQTSDTDEDNWLESQNVSWALDSGKTYNVVLPPLRPNSFYRIKITYFGSDNMYAIIRMIHSEGIADWEKTPKNWMRDFKELSDRKLPQALSYRPSKNEILGYQFLIKDFNFTIPLATEAKTKLKDLTLKKFKNLNFSDAAFNDDDIVNFARAIQFADTNDTATYTIFDDHFNVYDYEGAYRLYQQYFKPYFDNNDFDSRDYITYFNNAIAAEKARYTVGLVPNTISWISDEIIDTYRPVSTYAKDFTTAYQNALVPDFGYVFYLNSKNDFRGGSPFLGVNISLAPTNKDVPLTISRLSGWQRLSIHTGVVINSLKEEKKREDFFKNNSAMIGIGYKLLNHALRINAGGVFYKKLDPIDGSKSFAIQPYIGVSIDIEIKKWLESAIPYVSNLY